ncbi:MAG: hypothetical protein ACK5UC_20240, partial [Planctomycetaceae bacterium]
MQDIGRGARRTGFGAGLRRGVAVVLAVVLAVAALACWLGKPGTSGPIAPSTAAPPTAARVAAGVALT